MLIMIGLIGDSVRTNRQMMEEILVARRDSQRMNENSHEINGCAVLTKDVTRE